MVTPDTVTIWLKSQALPIGILAGFILLAFLILKLSAARRRYVLSRERSNINEYSFVAHLARYKFDPLITGTTYRYLQDVQGIRFPILPSDRLDEDLGMDPDDVEQTIHELLHSLRRAPTPGLRYEPIITVEGLVRHLQASPRMQRNREAAA